MRAAAALRRNDRAAARRALDRILLLAGPDVNRPPAERVQLAWTHYNLACLEATDPAPDASAFLVEGKRGYMAGFTRLTVDDHEKRVALAAVARTGASPRAETTATAAQLQPPRGSAQITPRLSTGSRSAGRTASRLSARPTSHVCSGPSPSSIRRSRAAVAATA